MPKRTVKQLDEVQNARRVVLESVGEFEQVTVSKTLVSQVMAAMGRKGGKTGGKNAWTLLSDQRSEMGRLAAEKRWGKKKAKK